MADDSRRNPTQNQVNTVSLLDFVDTPDVAPTESTRSATTPELGATTPSTARELIGIQPAHIVELDTARIAIRFDGADQLVEAEIAPYVERALVELAQRDGQAVLVNCQPGSAPRIIGILQTRIPENVRVEASNVELQASRSITLKVGRAGLKLTADGDVELIGSRISAASRGLMRLAGRILRLN